MSQRTHFTSATASVGIRDSDVIFDCVDSAISHKDFFDTCEELTSRCETITVVECVMY